MRVQVGQDVEGVADWDQLGFSVAISGNLIAAGAREAGEDGEAYVYRLDNGVWSQVGQALTPVLAREFGGAFGNSIALSDTTVAISNQFGAASSIRVFDLVGQEWVLRGTPLGVTWRTSFGPTYLSMSRRDTNRICAGVDALFLAPGYVQCYEYIFPHWLQLGSVLDIESLGAAVATISGDGNVLAVGDSSGADINGVKSGKVWIYRFLDDDWRLVGEPILGAMRGSTLGATLSLSNNGALVAVGSDFGVFYNNTASIWVFTSATP